MKPNARVHNRQITVARTPATRVRAIAAAIAAAGGLLLAAGGAQASAELVTNGNDTGAGSLRAAIESGAREILVSTEQDIMITTPLTYSGERPLTIIGSGQTVMTMENITLLQASNGASLKVIGLNFSGPGGYDINNQAPADEPAGKGVFIDVRDDQTGTVSLTLKDVTVSGVANHGVHVSDCNLADDCGGGGGGAGEGSPAQIYVEFDNVTIDTVGQGKFDADGLRVDERGPGKIIFKATNSTFTRVGADGIELDEGQNGLVKVTVSNSRFEANGDYCDPAILEPFLDGFLAGEPDEAEFEDSDGVSEASLPGPVTGSPDDRCFEYEVDTYDSGFVEAYEYGIDVDDGFDIDEAGNGSIRLLMTDSTIIDNFDEGLDLDEEDAGTISITLAGTDASGNTDDAYKLTEEDDGGVLANVANATATGNGGKGFVFEEAGNGGLRAVVVGTTTSDNDDSDDTGIEAVQEDAGLGTLRVIDSDIADGVTLEGVELSQQ